MKAARARQFEADHEAGQPGGASAGPRLPQEAGGAQREEAVQRQVRRLDAGLDAGREGVPLDRMSASPSMAWRRIEWPARRANRSRRS